MGITGGGGLDSGNGLTYFDSGGATQRTKQPKAGHHRKKAPRTQSNNPIASNNYNTLERPFCMEAILE